MPIDSWLYAFILSLGIDVEIVQPEFLKRDIAAFAEKIAEHHKKSDCFQTRHILSCLCTMNNIE
ncbi:hypothetical protein [Treponema socranskii]|uniref:hypothetical protein n=1 Tax=Treponema socranskii TaxID=53419 RepID=UPI003D8A9474